MNFSRLGGATWRDGSGGSFCVPADTVRAQRSAVGLRRAFPKWSARLQPERTGEALELKQGPALST
jgi:hypothetical protein